MAIKSNDAIIKSKFLFQSGATKLTFFRVLAYRNVLSEKNLQMCNRCRYIHLQRRARCLVIFDTPWYSPV